MVACIERYEWEREAQKPKLKKKKEEKEERKAGKTKIEDIDTI